MWARIAYETMTALSVSHQVSRFNGGDVAPNYHVDGSLLSWVESVLDLLGSLLLGHD